MEKQTSINDNTLFFRIIIDLLYRGEFRNILKASLEFVKTSLEIICPDLKEIRIVIKVKMNPEIVNPIEPISEAKSKLDEAIGRS